MTNYNSSKLTLKIYIDCLFNNIKHVSIAICFTTRSFYCDRLLKKETARRHQAYGNPRVVDLCNCLWGHVGQKSNAQRFGCIFCYSSKQNSTSPLDRLKFKFIYHLVFERIEQPRIKLDKKCVVVSNRAELVSFKIELEGVGPGLDSREAIA